MHTKELGNFRVHYNSDFSGDLEIVNASGESFKVPYFVLSAMVAEKRRGELIRMLEDAGDAEILGYNDKNIGW